MAKTKIPSNAPDDIDSRFQELLNKASNLDTPPHDHIAHTDKTRSAIALWFTKGYFILIFIVLIGVPLYNFLTKPSELLSLRDILTSLAGIIGTPFGFVIGHYFKSNDSK